MITFQATVTGHGPTPLDARLDAETQANALADDRTKVVGSTYSAAYESTFDGSSDAVIEWSCSAFVELQQTAA